MAEELSNAEYEKLVALHEEYKQQHAAVGGALKEQMKALKSEFGCKTLKEAKRMLETLAKRKRIKGKKAKRLHDRIMKEHGDKIQ